MVSSGSIDPNAVLNGGVTPLLIASQQGHVEVVRLLMEARDGANDDLR